MNQPFDVRVLDAGDVASLRAFRPRPVLTTTWLDCPAAVGAARRMNRRCWRATDQVQAAFSSCRQWLEMNGAHNKARFSAVMACESRCAMCAISAVT